MSEYPDRKPRTRGECLQMPRPCPFVSCRYHLGSDAHVGIYETRAAVSRIEPSPEELAETCALDVADRTDSRSLSNAEIAEFLGLSLSEVGAAFVSASRRLRRQDEDSSDGEDAA